MGLQYEPREPHGKKTKGPFLKRNVTSSYHSNRLRLRQSTLLRSGGTCCDEVGAAALFVPKMLLRESKSHMECENQPTTPSEHVLCSAPVVVSPIRHCGWPSCPFLSPNVLVTKEWSPRCVAPEIAIWNHILPVCIPSSVGGPKKALLHNLGTREVVVFSQRPSA